MRTALLLACCAASRTAYAPPTPRSTPPHPRASRRAVMQQNPPPPKGGLTEAEKLAGSAASFFGGLAKAAEEAADTWVNSGWQVKKRAGQIVPEIRPNAVDVTQRAAPFLSPEKAGLGGGGGGLAAAGANGSLVTPQEDALQGEFLGFLAEVEASMVESGMCRVSPNGELTFRSRDDLAQVVVKFSIAKLSELAAAARALARYVDDLEVELEAADDAVVKLRKDMVAMEAKASAEQARLRSLEDDLARLDGELIDAQQLIDVQRAAKETAEQQADEAARALMELQAAEAAAGAEASTDRALELEEMLMAAEASAMAAEQAKASLERRLAEQRAEQQQQLEARRRDEERLRELQQRAEAAERAADEKAAEVSRVLVESQSEVTQLKRQLEQLQVAKTASTFAKPDAAFEEEAQRLQAEISEQLARATDALEPAAAASNGTATPATPSRPPALSRMTKAQLIEECTERNLLAEGTVAELRVRLRVERKRDVLVAELADRGWSERQARRALDKVGWDVDAAITELSASR
ncbi:hypothetical protein AB1Y20_004018 [Prymnesium parvum]|uniref:UBA domain-containing protein n=1 Tax=Prymnesium parvum TaxID=97485 RepID=A0AB34J691_PRYPA